MLLGLFALIALVLIFAVTRPDIFRVERSIAVKAESAKVDALLIDVHQFPSWSPRQNLDPGMQTMHSPRIQWARRGLPLGGQRRGKRWPYGDFVNRVQHQCDGKS